MALRYLFLVAHYSDELNFTWESLQAAQNALDNLREIVRGWESPAVISNPAEPAEESQDDKWYGDFIEALNNDLNTSQALAVMWNMVKSKDTSKKVATLLKMDQVFGLGLGDY